MAVSFDSTSVQLIHRIGCHQNDSEAWERFVRRYAPAIRQWCCENGLQMSDAEDVTQEVLLRVARQIPHLQYDPQQRFRGWLFTVMRGAWVDWVQAQQREKLARRAAADHQQATTTSVDDHLVSRRGLLHDRELFLQASLLVRHRVSAVSWQAFESLALHSLPLDEVCESLQLSKVAALGARYRVTRMLREEIERLRGGQ